MFIYKNHTAEIFTSKFILFLSLSFTITFKSETSSMFGYSSYNINPHTNINDSQPPNVQNAPFAHDEDENPGDYSPQSPVTPKGT